MAQFDRIYRITLGVQDEKGVIIEAKPHEEGLNVEFEISKTLAKQSNRCTLKIYNLSEDTSKLMEVADTICILEVGYSEDAGLKRIFIGWVTDCYSYISGSEKITEMTLFDGHVAIRDSVVSLSYAKGVSRKKAIDDIANDMGLIVNYANDCEFTTFANGFSFTGAGRECLTKICAGTNLEWSIQNNVLQILKQGGNKTVQAIKLSVKSGLVGFVEKVLKGPKKAEKPKAANKTTNKKGKKKEATTPKVPKEPKYKKKRGWKLKCLLQPVINPGDLIYIDSKEVKGWFKIESLKHEGSYNGQNWYTTLEVYEIKPKDAEKNKDTASSTKKEGAAK